MFRSRPTYSKFIPTDTDTEFKSVVRKQGHFSGLLGGQHSLALRQYHHRGDHLNLVGYPSNECEGRKGFSKRHIFVVWTTEAALAVWVAPSTWS